MKELCAYCTKMIFHLSKIFWKKDNSVKIHDRNIKLLAKEMYKVYNNILPNALGEFLTNRALNYNLRHASTFIRDKVSTTYYGTNSLQILGPKIWDLLPT